MFIHKVATDALLSTINNNISLKATQVTTYTKSETDGQTETYTRNAIMWLIQSQYTVVAPLQMGINLMTGKFLIGIAPEYYDSLDAKFNNTTGDVSIAIKNKYGIDVAVFSNNVTKDVPLNWNCYITNNLSVLGTSSFVNIMNLKTSSQGGGTLRIIFNIYGHASSIGYYNRSDSRCTAAGDMWASGVNSWNRVGYTIGTPVLKSCLNIYGIWAVTADYKLGTPLIQTDTIRGNGADQIIIMMM